MPISSEDKELIASLYETTPIAELAAAVPNVPLGHLKGYINILEGRKKGTMASWQAKQKDTEKTSSVTPISDAKKWTAESRKQYVLANYETKSVKEIAADIGVESVQAVYNIVYRARKQSGIKTKQPAPKIPGHAINVLTRDREYIAKNYGSMSNAEIARSIGGVTADYVESVAIEMGLQKPQKAKPAPKLIIAPRPAKSIEDEPRVPGRKYYIQRRQKQNQLTIKQQNFLYDWYMEYGPYYCAKELNVSYDVAAYYAGILGLRQPRKKQQEPQPILDMEMIIEKSSRWPWIAVSLGALAIFIAAILLRQP